MDETRQDQVCSVVSPFFILCCVASFSVALFLLSWFHLQVFTATDATYRIMPLSTHMLDVVNGAPSSVEVGLVITRFSEFSITDNKFAFEGSLWFRFDPALISLETIEGIAVDNGSFMERRKIYTQLIGGRLFVQYAVHISFQTPLNYAAFPSDDHRLYVAFTHPEVSPGTVIFEAAKTDFIIQEDMSIRGWSEHDRSVSTGYVETQIASAAVQVNRKHPAVYFGMDLRRSSMRDLITILLPLLVLFALSLCAFLMDREVYWAERLGVILESIVGLIAFRFVMESISPKVAYFMRADYLFLLFLGLNSAVFLINFLAHRMSVAQERLFIIACSLILVVSYYVFIVYV